MLKFLLRRKEFISGRFPITKSELARFGLRDEGLN